MTLNGFDALELIVADAFEALKNLLTQSRTFDVIILDPPAFIKKHKDKKEGVIAYQRINEMALKLLNQNGILISCSCSMHLSEEDLMNVVRRASLKTHAGLQLLERGFQAPDHPVHLAMSETAYLKALFLRKTL